MASLNGITTWISTSLPFLCYTFILRGCEGIKIAGEPASCLRIIITQGWLNIVVGWDSLSLYDHLMWTFNLNSYFITPLNVRQSQWTWAKSDQATAKRLTEIFQNTLAFCKPIIRCLGFLLKDFKWHIGHYDKKRITALILSH